jgi:ferrous iron transport protein A
MQGELKAISELGVNAHALVHHFTGGKELINRLLVLGFTLGTEIEVIQNYGKGPIILSVKDSRVALGRGEANKIMVRELKYG